MGKGANRLDAITQQNELLKQQNELLREQIELLKKSSIQPKNDDREIFVENIDRDEMRSGFLVTTHRKKLWNVQIKMLREFARICKKHGIRWFVFYGTLLGAARHKGFVPWDDDIDVMMLRPDYEKFKRVAPDEVKPPYFFDAWFNHRLESEEKISVPEEKNLQLCKLEQEKNLAAWWPFWPLLKIRDLRTSMIQWPERNHVQQGMWIDIFPFDPAPPFANEQQKTIYTAASELLLAAALPKRMQAQLDAGRNFFIKREDLQQLLNTTHRKRALNFENFMLKNFYRSERICEFRDLILKPRPDRPNVTYAMKDFDEIVWLPFEKIEVPVPIGYEKCLDENYGDWHTIKIYNIHSADSSPDISSEEYFRQRVIPQR